MRWVAKAIIVVGTSGWQYRDWRGYFYPSDLAQRAWLGFYAERFGIVEVNNSFYRLPERDTFNRWRGGTPDDFRFAVKASRYLTHIRRLPEPAEPVRRLLEHSDGLGAKRRPILLQLSPSLRCDLDDLRGVLAAFPRHVRVAVEPRHESWWTAAARQVLTDHGAALCWADRARTPPRSPVRPADAAPR